MNNLIFLSKNNAMHRYYSDGWFDAVINHVFVKENVMTNLRKLLREKQGR